MNNTVLEKSFWTSHLICDTVLCKESPSLSLKVQFIFVQSPPLTYMEAHALLSPAQNCILQ